MVLLKYTLIFSILMCIRECALLTLNGLGYRKLVKIHGVVKVVQTGRCMRISSAPTVARIQMEVRESWSSWFIGWFEFFGCAWSSSLDELHSSTTSCCHPWSVGLDFGPCNDFKSPWMEMQWPLASLIIHFDIPEHMGLSPCALPLQHLSGIGSC